MKTLSPPHCLFATVRAIRLRSALLLPFLLLPALAQAQAHSVAREWNEVLLKAISKDHARPTVHARNLFHTSVALYDAWAAYDEVASTYFLGKNVHGYVVPFMGVNRPADVKAAREEAMSYAAYRLLRHRFATSPGRIISYARFDSLMAKLGYDPGYTSTNYLAGRPADLGNYLAQHLIIYGMQDGANEAVGYGNLHYEPVNPPLPPVLPGNPTIIDPNRWQPLALEVFIGQSGIELGSMPPFLSPEWGKVKPFALKQADATIYNRDGFDYWVYHDPGPPPYLDPANGANSEEFIWTFSRVPTWSSHLDPADSVMWDISPAAIGNIDPQLLPRNFAAHPDFYDILEGGDLRVGHTLNPHTGLPYEPQVVPRGDYTRVLAEFWADGPGSETPPGHWFTILNYVNDHPGLVKRFNGQGPVLNDLEWDVKSYLTLGGAMHDVAITAWGIKGWYDYIRPISAIRAMADRGQCSDASRMSYDPNGIILIPGYIELVEPGDPLDGGGFYVGRIKVRAWRGPEYITNPATDMAGVGWILAANWWPYQRPTFVTPPFAGYISGHSTYSRTAAEVMTLLTGDAFFPGGMGEFHAPKNEFLVFEQGPSVDLTLQWATYRDASDQCSLSRIWGGIHPPADDIAGRIIGQVIGPEAFAFAETHFKGEAPGITQPASTRAFPNPVEQGKTFNVFLDQAPGAATVEMIDLQGRSVYRRSLDETAFPYLNIPAPNVAPGIYVVRVWSEAWETALKIQVLP